MTTANRPVPSPKLEMATRHVCSALYPALARPRRKPDKSVQNGDFSTDDEPRRPSVHNFAGSREIDDNYILRRDRPTGRRRTPRRTRACNPLLLRPREAAEPPCGRPFPARMAGSQQLHRQLGGRSWPLTATPTSPGRWSRPYNGLTIGGPASPAMGDADSRIADLTNFEKAFNRRALFGSPLSPPDFPQRQPEAANPASHARRSFSGWMLETFCYTATANESKRNCRSQRQGLRGQLPPFAIWTASR